MKHRILLLASLLALSVVGYAQRVTDQLDRGLVAVKVSGGVFLSWRVLPEEYYDVTYNVYRDGQKITETPLAVSNFTDKSGTAASTYSIKAVVRGNEENKAVRARLASEEGNGDGSSLADDGWGRNGGHGGFNYHVSQNESNETVTVSYSSEKPVKVTTMLANSQGYVYRRAEQTDGSAITLSYSTLRHGQYILYVSAGNEQFAEKFSVK